MGIMAGGSFSLTVLQIHRSGVRERNHHGFTLMEVLTVVALIGILTRMAVPSIRAAVDQSRAREESQNILSTLQEIRSEAVRTRRSIFVKPTTTGFGWTIGPPGGSNPVVGTFAFTGAAGWFGSTPTQFSFNGLGLCRDLGGLAKNLTINRNEIKFNLSVNRNGLIERNAST